VAGFYSAVDTLSALATELNIKMEALLPLARHVGVIDTGAEAWKLSLEQEAVLRAAAADLVPTVEVVRILGFESWAWRSVANAGVLKSFASSVPGRMYLRADVEAFVAKITASATTVPDETSVSLRTFSRKHNISIGDVLLRILDGSLKATQAPLNQTGIRSIRIVSDGCTLK